MTQRRRLRRPPGKLNRSEAEEKRGLVPPPLMLFTPYPADSELQRGIGLISGAASGESDGSSPPPLSSLVLASAGVGDWAIPFSWRVGARLSDRIWRQRRRVCRHRAERGSAGNRSVALCSLRPDEAAGTRLLWPRSSAVDASRRPSSPQNSGTTAHGPRTKWLGTM